jgi:hypothetical protein
MLDLEKVGQVAVRPHRHFPLTAASGRAAIDMKDFTPDELGPFQATGRRRDCLASRPCGPWAGRKRRGCASGECIRVLIAPGATAFARASRLAYSIAIERMTALRPPLIKGLEGHRACFPGGTFCSACRRFARNTLAVISACPNAVVCSW